MVIRIILVISLLLLSCGGQVVYSPPIGTTVQPDSLSAGDIAEKELADIAEKALAKKQSNEKLIGFMAGSIVTYLLLKNK